MNESITSIIDEQFNQYNLGSLTESKIDLDDEDILFGLREDRISIGSAKELTDGNKHRLSLIMPYIQNYIVKYKPQKLDIIIALGDILKKNYPGIPTLCLSKYKNIDGILIPNIDFFTGVIYNTLKFSNEDIEYDKKNNSSVFAGSSTGPFKNNTRVLYGEKCLKSQKHFCHITNLCQADHSEWIKEYPFIDNLVTVGISIESQLKNKVVVNIDGNTVCWSRLYWQMNSNSIPVYINKTEKDMQFFDFADNSGSFVSCSLDDSISTIDEILDSYTEEKVQEINSTGKLFCNTYFGEYMKNPEQYLQEIIDYTFSKITTL